MNINDDDVVVKDGGQHLKNNMVRELSTFLHLLQVDSGGAKDRHGIGEIHTASAVLFLELDLQTVDNHLPRKDGVLGVVLLSLKQRAFRVKIVVAVKNTVKDTVSVTRSEPLSLGSAEPKTSHS